MSIFIEIPIGVFLALAFVSLVKLKSKNFAEEKFFFFVGLIVTAFIYVVFGFLSDSNYWKIIEISGVPFYTVLAWLGWKKSAWFLVFGWAFHVVWDAVLHGASTPFVPHWYIGFCIGFDLAVAGYIGFSELKNSK